MKLQLLIPAAGMGLRLGSKLPKALVELAGRALIARTLDRFDPLGLRSKVVVAVPLQWQAAFNAALRGRRYVLVGGGAERQQSVSNGLEHIEADTEIVIIHDCARPFVDLQSIEKCIDAAHDAGAATVATPCVDTILDVQGGGLAATLDRERLWACQTPQAFRVDVIRAAHAAAGALGRRSTDDASLVRMNGGTVRVVEGRASNRKITTPEDLAFAEYAIREDLGEVAGARERG